MGSLHFTPGRMEVKTATARGGSFKNHRKHSDSHFVRVTEHFTLHRTQRHPLRQDIRRHSFHYSLSTLSPFGFLAPPLSLLLLHHHQKKSLSTHLRGVAWHGELQLFIDPFFWWTTDQESGELRGNLRDRHTNLSRPTEKSPFTVLRGLNI